MGKNEVSLKRSINSSGFMLLFYKIRKFVLTGDENEELIK